MFTEVFAKGDLPRFGRILVQVHPFHVGKMVLDGVAPGSLTLEQSFYQQGVAYDDSLRRFIADCLHQSDCPLTGTVANGIARIQKFLNDLDAKPIPAGPGRVLAEGLATPGIYYALYSGRDGWPGLRSSLTSAFAGDGSGLIGNVDAVYGRQPDGTYVGNLFPAFYAITCTDTPELGGPPHIAALAREWKKTAPVFGESDAWSLLPCWHWAPVGTSKPALPVFHATGSAPILLVATTHDPATPYAGGVEVSKELDNATLLAYDSDGHTAYRRGSTCIDTAVDAYLIQGTAPPHGTRCSPDSLTATPHAPRADPAPTTPGLHEMPLSLASASSIRHSARPGGAVGRGRRGSTLRTISAQVRGAQREEPSCRPSSGTTM